IPQVADLGEERAQSGEILDLLEGAVARHRGISSHHRLGRDVAAHPGAGGNHRIRADCHMVGDADAAPEHDTIADMHASRYAYHPAYQTTLTNGDVVSDLHEIVDFGVAPDARRGERRTIDCRIGADLDIVLDDHGADRMDAARPSTAAAGALGLPGCVAEAVRAETDVVLEDHAV